MCGRFNVIDDPLVHELMDILGVPLYPETRRNVAPGGKGQIVLEAGCGRILEDAYWSLMIEPKPEGPGYRPSPKYSTFNARSTNLMKSPLWRKRFVSQRAIVPVSGFHEWVGEKGHKQCYNIRGREDALALAGLYEYWEFGDETVPAFTVITLPPHPRFSHIHPKSIPLMLRQADFDAWLDPDFHDTNAFQDLLHTRISVPLVVEPVDSPNRLQPVGAEEVIAED
ncbi:SOS response-associated peptidase family protein [Marinobacteraceae bacterium S3BR75-40.1]